MLFVAENNTEQAPTVPDNLSALSISQEEPKEIFQYIDANSGGGMC
jgi:hypothetical protein